MNRSKWLKPLIFGCIVIAFITLYFFTPVRSYLSADRLQELREIILATGFWAPLVFILFYTAATVLCLPGSALTILAGIIFGPWWGTLVTIIAANLGANAAFLISRYLGQSVAEKFVKGNMQSLAGRIQENGFWVMFGLRMLPIVPFNILNYGAGLTPIKWRAYVWASLIGMIPGTFAYVSLGNTVNHIRLTDPQAWLQVQVWGPFLLILVLVIGGKFVQKIPWVQKRLAMKNVAQR